jgi:hypothetical protein
MTAITLDTLLEYAAIRYADGDHLAEAVLLEVEEGKDPIELRDEAARRESFLTAYFADCVASIQDAQ